MVTCPLPLCGKPCEALVESNKTLMCPDCKEERLQRRRDARLAKLGPKHAEWKADVARRKAEKEARSKAYADSLADSASKKAEAQAERDAKAAAKPSHEEKLAERRAEYAGQSQDAKARKAAAQRKRYAADPAKISEQRKANREADPGRYRAYTRKAMAANPEVRARSNRSRDLIRARNAVDRASEALMDANARLAQLESND